MSKLILVTTSLCIFFIGDLVCSKIKILKILGIFLNFLEPIPIPCFNIFKFLFVAEAISGKGFK